jgi:glucosylceramidase
VLWNIALDPQGGPVEAPNSGCRRCSGVVTVNQATHAVSYGAKYYQMGQVSKFVQPGAVRVNSNSFVTYTTSGPTSAFSVSAGIDDVAVQNPDGSQVLVANNTSPTAIAFAVSWQGQAFTYTLPARATITFAPSPGTDIAHGER